MELLERDNLIDYMGDTDRDFNRKTIEEQNQIIAKKILDVLDYIGSKNPCDCYIQDRKKKFLSGRQIGTLMDSIKLLDKREFIDAYLEMMDFVHDNGVKDNPVLNNGEYDILILQLNRIVDKMRE